MRKALLIVGIGAFLCFAALWGYVESDAFAERLRPHIVQPLQELLGPAARIGKVKATLLPLVIEVRDISVPSGRTAESLAVRKFRVYINPLPLLWRHVSISSITVLEPRVGATRETDGTIDIAAVIENVRKNVERRQGTSHAPVPVTIRTVTVRSGSVAVRDAASGAQVMVSGLDAKTIFRSFPTNGIVRISSGVIAVSIPSYPAVESRLQATGTFRGAAISLSSVEMRSKSARFSTSGTIVASGDGAIDLKVQARLTRGWFGTVSGMMGRREQAPELETAASLAGTIESPRLNGTAVLTNVPIKGIVVNTARVDYAYADRVLTVGGTEWVLKRNGRTLTVGPIAVEAGYRDGTFRLFRTSIIAADAEVHASGTISAERGYDLVLSAASQGAVELPKFLFGIESSGAASLSGTLSGSPGTPVFAGTLSAGPVTIREVAVQGVTGMVRYEDRTVSLAGATIRQDDSRYLFDGSVSFTGQEPYYNARLSIIRSDVVSVVKLFYKALPLELSASGELTFSGTRRSFRGKGHLDLDAGAAYGESFEKGALDVELNSSRVVFPQLFLEKGGGHIEGKGWIAFHGAYYGSIESAGVDLSSIDHLRPLSLSGTLNMEVSSSGSFSEPQVTAHAVSPAISLRGIVVGHAVCDAAIRNGELTASASLDGGRNRSLSMDATLGLSKPYAWSARSVVHVADEDPSSWVQGAELLSRLRISSDARISLVGELGSAGSINGSAVLPRISVLIADHRIENEGDAVVQVVRGALSVRTLVLTGTGTRVSVTGGLRPGRDVDLALEGDINLSLLRLLYREIEHGDGTALLHLALRDDLTHPSVDGRVTVRDGMLKIRDVPQKFSGLQGTIVFDRTRISTDGLAADVGGGRVTVIGSAQLREAALLDFSARAIIEGVTVRYPPGLTATLGGTLYYDGTREVQTLAGEVSIQQARYEKRIEWKSMLVDITQGITRKKKTDIGWIGETRLNIRFTGSENILFESNLAKIPFSIDALFRGTVNQVQLLGRIEARAGELYFRNNVFKVLYASADFVDPGRINPVLDVQTETRVREYRIRLAVSGNADRAVVTFLSDPPLADSDILALLALGRKGEELKGKEANVGVGESFSFATGKFQDLLESRARSLTGLDRFQVDPYINKSDTAVPRVTVGKEVVEKRLFMTYSSNIGGTTPEQNLRIEYILNRNISLLGEYDELGQIGADLKFRFEFR